MKGKRWDCFWLGLLLLCACRRVDVYQASAYLDGQKWPQATPLSFSFQAKAPRQAYDIFILVSNDVSYPYQNLYITYYLEDEAKCLIHKELINCPLFDPKTGAPLGRGIGKSKRNEWLVATGQHFSQAGSYTLRLEHFMRTGILPGLQAVGVKVVPSDN